MKIKTRFQQVLFYLIATELFLPQVWATYLAPSILILVNRSEIIARGFISAIDAERKSYKFEILYALKGNLELGDEIEIAQFKDWSCGVRGESYELGQEMLVFASFNEERTIPMFVINGLGNEGEARILRDQIYISYAPGPQVRIETSAGTILAKQWDVDVAEAAISNLLQWVEYRNRAKCDSGISKSERAPIIDMTNPLIRQYIEGLRKVRESDSN